MAIGIVIYEKNQTLFDKIKQRLSKRFPDAYISMVSEINGISDNEELFSDKHILFDNKQFDDSSFEDEAVAIYDNKGIIDVSRIIEAIRITPTVIPSTNNDGKQLLLLPFVYINERENYILNHLKYIYDADISLRLDFMSGYRMPHPHTTNIKPGGLTSLLQAAIQKSFQKEDLLQYCSCDSTGFITPGRPSGDEDVFDAGVDVLCKITSAAKEITSQKNKKTNSIICAEGLRSDEYAKLAKYCDKVEILVPSRKTEETLGLDPLISKLSRAAQGCDIEIICMDEIKSLEWENSYEAVV